MANNTYRSGALLASLRADIPSNPVENCEMCLLQNRIVCVHLTARQYASLKAGKRKLATEGEVYRIFECGHVCHALRRVALPHGAPTVKTKGLCSECWRYIASNGKRVCHENVGKRRKKVDAEASSKGEDTPNKRLRRK
ncbi:hypothetical protein F5Y09DRAFT_352828 [Xylaria sp. FL1042]|nr:hypothetical protein F5Y09DRAFT_352828 [Xylaria sp. FL1042]